MADTTALSDISSLLYELRGPMQALYPRDFPLMAEWHGVGQDDASAGRVSENQTGNIPDDNREIFSGNQVRIPLDLHFLEAGGWVSETGSVNQPIAPEFNKATLALTKFVQPISVTLEADEDSMSNSAVQAVARLVAKAREALANHVNDAMNGNGDGQLAVADTTQASAGGLVLKVVSIPDSLYVGKIVDVLTATTGADPGQGKGRKIASFQRTASPPTITFATAQATSTGGSGNITLANTVAVYVEGSYGNVMQGLTQAANFGGTDTFEGIDRSVTAQWQGTDGRSGTTTTADLTDDMLDAGVLVGQRRGAFSWDFGIGDPRAINVYKNSKISEVRYQPETAKIPSGFSGIVYNGTGQPIPLVPERKFVSGAVRLLRRDCGTIYGRKAGPDFDRTTGSQWMRFNRNTSVEAWLVDRLNWGFHTPNTIVSFQNLSTS